MTWSALQHPAVIVAALAAMAGPLVYGALTDQFTLSHHVIRFVIVSAIVVVVWTRGTSTDR